MSKDNWTAAARRLEKKTPACETFGHYFDYLTDLCTDCGLAREEWVRQQPYKWSAWQCECGSDKVKAPGHSQWCPAWRPVTNKWHL